jgi:hypothetical protein
MTREEWYTRRDKRTDGCTNVSDDYKNAVVRVVVTEDIAAFRVQAMTHLSLLMLAKWCRNIYLKVKDAPGRLPGSGGSFVDFIAKQVKAVDPACHFVVGDWEKPVSLTLFIGAPAATVEGDFVSTNCIGWLACCAFNRCSAIPVSRDESLIFGPAFAACLAVAEVFRYAVGRKGTPYERWYSLWSAEVFDAMPDSDNGLTPGVVSAGRVYLIGCGSIGSSFLYLLPYLKWDASWLLIDPDGVEEQNTSSSLLFGYPDAETRVKKVSACQRYLEHTGLSAETFEGDYRDYPVKHESSGLASPDVVLCFANENNIWKTIQHRYPPLCFHATTSKSWGIHVGRHIPLKENCVNCTFQSYGDSAPVMRCAEGDLPTPAAEEGSAEEPHTGILPFLAPAAALIALAGLVKTMAFQDPEMDNSIEFNMIADRGVFLANFQSFGNCDICKYQRALYAKFGQAAMHWHLSVSE